MNTDTPTPRQYYYKNNSCKADLPTDHDCICWHDEFTQPLSAKDQEVMNLEWRTKPMNDTPTNSEALPLTNCSPLRFWLVGWSRLGMQGHHSLTPRGWRYAKSAKAYARMEKARLRHSLENETSPSVGANDK